VASLLAQEETARTAPATARPRRERTVAGVLADVGPAARVRLRSRLGEAPAYPPAAVRLVAYKQERELEVWVPRGSRWSRAHTYAILAASGGPGPKLRRGDGQVPEGRYALTGLNPASAYHLSIRVGYPNARDRAWARLDGRTDLGGDIYIHGRAVSIGCLAIGDTAIEELFVLLADVGLSRASLLVAPDRDLRTAPAEPAWLRDLYRDLGRELADLRGPRT
jgi:hypothetical protein